LILASGPGHSHRGNESGHCYREEHGSGAGIVFLNVTHGPRIAPMRPTLSSIPTAVALTLVS
jgi:hypothetical protein